MSRNWDISLTDPTCDHGTQCTCVLKIKGIGVDTSGLAWEGKGPLKQQFIDGPIWMDTWAKGLAGVPLQETEHYLKSKLTKDSSVRVIPPPYNLAPMWPTDVVLPSANRGVKQALKQADVIWFEKRLPGLSYSWDEMEKYVWSDIKMPDENGKGGEMEPRPLWALAMRQQSSYVWACGKTNGRPHVVTAMADMYPRKLADAMLSFDRRHEPENMKKILDMSPEILNLMYSMMGVSIDKPREWKCSTSTLRSMYLGASSGLHDARNEEIETELGEKVKVSSKGKKIDFHEQILLQIHDFIVNGVEPNVDWSMPTKNENFFNFSKQYSDEEWAAFLDKLRLFNIPSGVFIYLERMVSLERHLIERGRVIRIGHKWPRGGSETLANCLGIDETNCWQKIIVEGDFKKFDQSVPNALIQLYWSMLSVHFDSSSPDFPILEKITQFLVKNMCYRICYLMGSLWVVVRGGVPSGAFNTSHLDSWVVAFLFAAFLTYILFMTPIDQQENLELYIKRFLKIVVYGDDHLYNKGPDSIWNVKFCGTSWAAFCKDFFDMDVRDIIETSYCSRFKDGFIVHQGATFLQHQQVPNPCKREGQTKFLPCRETRHYLIRAIYSREPRPRDEIDVMLSCIGQAYSTYAASRNAYDRIQILYEQLGSIVTSERPLNEVMMDRLSYDDLKRIRMMAIQPEELTAGFPSWERLVEKNTYDMVYQEISREPESGFVDYDNWII